MAGPDDPVDERPAAVVVAPGMPDAADLAPGPAVVRHGAARVLPRAATEALSGRAPRG